MLAGVYDFRKALKLGPKRSPKTGYQGARGRPWAPVGARPPAAAQALIWSPGVGGTGAHQVLCRWHTTCTVLKVTARLWAVGACTSMALSVADVLLHAPIFPAAVSPAASVQSSCYAAANVCRVCAPATGTATDTKPKYAGEVLNILLLTFVGRGPGGAGGAADTKPKYDSDTEQAYAAYL